MRGRSRLPVAEEGATGGWRALRSLLPYLWPSEAPSLRLRVVLGDDNAHRGAGGGGVHPGVLRAAPSMRSRPSMPASWRCPSRSFSPTARPGSCRSRSTRRATPSSSTSRSGRSAPSRSRYSATCMRCRCDSTSGRQTGRLSQAHSIAARGQSRSCCASVCSRSFPLRSSSFSCSSSCGTCSMRSSRSPRWRRWSSTSPTP